MRCYCCDAEIPLARKVQLRPWLALEQAPGPPESVAYLSYVEELTFRWAFLCLACYRTLDNAVGCAEVGGRPFNLAGRSRADRAPIGKEAKYRAFQRRQAAQMGLDLGPGP